MVTVFDKLYWMRVGFGILFGVAAEYVFKLDYFDGILLGILGYLTSYYVARFVFFKTVDKKNVSKLYTAGIGAYVMMFIFTWLLLFTLYVVKV